MTPPNIIDYDHGISAIDSGYYRPGLAAIHLIVEGSTAALGHGNFFFCSGGNGSLMPKRYFS